MDGVERRGLAVDGTRSNRPTSQMVGSAEGPVSSVVRKLEGERGKRKCERRYTSTPRLFSLLLFPFPSSSSLSSLLSIWVRPVHSPACHVRHAMAKYVRRVMFYLGWGQNLSVYFIRVFPSAEPKEAKSISTRQLINEGSHHKTVPKRNFL